MEQFKPSSPGKGHRRYAVAFMVGAALSTLGPATASAAQIPQATLQAVNDLSRYCTTCWRNARLHPDTWTDSTQEVFARLLERLPQEDWDRVLQTEGEERREFVRAIDTVKKRVQRSKHWSSRALDEVADRSDLRERRLADDREAVRHAAAELLSPRQQQILQLTGAGCSVQDIAEKLQTSAERISDEKYKAIQKLRAKLSTDMECEV